MKLSPALTMPKLCINYALIMPKLWFNDMFNDGLTTGLSQPVVNITHYTSAVSKDKRQDDGLKSFFYMYEVS